MTLVRCLCLAACWIAGAAGCGRTTQASVEATSVEVAHRESTPGVKSGTAESPRLPLGQADGDPFELPRVPLQPAQPATLPAPPMVAPEPAPPPMPFRFLGAVTGDHVDAVFLQRDGRVHLVRPGDILGDEYRVDAVTEESVDFTYLPMQQRQSLPLR